MNRIFTTAASIAAAVCIASSSASAFLAGDPNHPQGAYQDQRGFNTTINNSATRSSSNSGLSWTERLWGEFKERIDRQRTPWGDTFREHLDILRNKGWNINPNDLDVRGPRPAGTNYVEQARRAQTEMNMMTDTKNKMKSGERNFSGKQKTLSNNISKAESRRDTARRSEQARQQHVDN